MTLDTETAIALLQGAKRRLDSGSESWICWALDEAACSSSDLNAITVCEQLRCYIMANLDGSEFLAQWVTRKTGLIRADFSGTDAMRLARLAWIDRMIQSLNDTGTLP